MGGLKFTVSKDGIVLSATVDVTLQYELQVGSSMAALITRMPESYEAKLRELLKSGVPSVFVHPILHGYETKWFRWWIEPFQGGYCFSGSEIVGPRQQEDIDIYLSHYGRMRVEPVR